MGRPKGSLNKTKRAPNKRPRPGGKSGGRELGTPNNGPKKGRLKPRNIKKVRRVGRAVWQRLDEEDDLAFACFLRWRDLDDTVRDVPAFVTIHEPWMREKEITQAMVEDWRDEHQWNERSKIWDRDGLKMRLFRQRRAASDMKDKHANCAKLALDVAMNLLRTFTYDPENPPRMGELAALMKVSVDIERMSRDLPDTSANSTIIQVIAPDPVEMNKASARAYGIKPESK